MRIAIFASGNGSNFENIASTVFKKVKVALLITNKKDAYAITRAEKLNIPYWIVNYKDYISINEAEKAILTKLKEYQIDAIVLAGYMRILGDTLINEYENKIINIHPSLLPSFKGANGILDAYEYGVKVTGVTVHYVNSELDGGKIIAQESFNCDKMELREIEELIHQLEYRLYLKVIKQLWDGD